MSFIPCIPACDIVGSARNINTLQRISMIHTKDHTTGYLIDPWRRLGAETTKTDGALMGRPLP